MLDAILLQNFKSITKYDIEGYLGSFQIFARDNVSPIIGFSSGLSKNVPQSSFSLLESLLKESIKLDGVITRHSRRFNTTDYWDLLEIVEDIRTKLQTVNKASKWSRSSVVNGVISNTPTTSQQLKQNETLEKFVEKVGTADKDNSWYQLAIDNDLKEEDYTPNGGNSLKISSSGSQSYNVLSVVDNIDEVTLLGKDVAKKFKWNDDGDLETVEGEEAFLQNLKIILDLKKGENPEFPGNGLDPKVFSGVNINGLSYPVLMRQIGERLKSDDTIASYSINKIERVKDSTSIELEVASLSGQIFSITQLF